MNKKWLIPTLALVVASLIATGCGKSDNAAGGDKKTIRISFNPGPYSDQFKNGVAPYLENKGYKIEYTEFTDGIQPNVAVSKGEIDANVFQHPMYLQSINEREKIDLVGAVQVPTPPMGLYSKKHQSLDDIPKGAKVNLPNEPVNMLRALKVLQEVGWIALKDDIDPLKASLKDVTGNPHEIEFYATEPAQGPRALPDVDFAAIQGNFAVSNDIPLSSALQLEKLTDPFTNIVAIDSKNKNAQFVKDIVEGYHSEEFQNYIKSNEIYKGYKLPSYFKQ